METFLLGIGDRLLQVAVRDQRGAEGAVLTLASEGSAVRLFPVPPQTPPKPAPTPTPAPKQDPAEGESTTIYPGFPIGLTEENLEGPHRLVLDTTELPNAILVFSITRFAEQAARAALAQHANVRLTPEEAEAWGWEAGNQ